MAYSGETKEFRLFVGLKSTCGNQSGRFSLEEKNGEI